MNKYIIIYPIALFKFEGDRSAYIKILKILRSNEECVKSKHWNYPKILVASIADLEIRGNSGMLRC